MKSLQELEADYERAVCAAVDAKIAARYELDDCRRTRDALHEASVKERALDASECRMRVILDDTRSWSSVREMLDDVLGTWDTNEAHGSDWRTHYPSKKAWHLARAMLDHEREKWIDAYENGNGIYCFGVQGEYLCRASGKWREDENSSCFGFYERDAWPSQGTLDVMGVHALPGHVDASDVDVLGEHEEPIEEEE